MAKQFTLGKEERLKSRKQTEQLFSNGKRFTLTPFRIHYKLNETENLLLHPVTIGFGVGVSGKIFKNAVDRNRIKRLVREAYRLQKTILQEKLKEKKQQINIFFIYTGKELPDYKEVYEKMGKSLGKLCVLLNE